MDRRLVIVTLVSLAAVANAGRTNAQQLLANLTPARIEEAIQLAGDDKATAKFVQSYVLQTRTGIGSGPLIGYVSTPFSRVVMAAVAARKAGRTFVASDVPADLLMPVLQILVLPQSAAYAAVPAVVEAVTVSPRSQDGADLTIRPIITAPAASEQYALFGVVAKDSGAIVGSIPLAALAADNTVRVSFSQVVRGSSALTNCKDCAVPLSVARIR
jgi:hypothetical protein